MVIAFAAVAASVGVAVVAVKAFGAVIKDQAQKLDAYSPAVSMAVSQSEIRQELAMFRRGERVGNDVAKWEGIRGQVSEKLTDIGTEILSLLLKFVNEFEPQIKMAVAAMDLIPPGIELMVKHLELLAEIARGKVFSIPDTLQEIAAANRRFAKAMQELLDRDKDKDEDLADPWLGEFYKILVERIAADAIPRPLIPPPPPGLQPGFFGGGGAAAAGAAAAAAAAAAGGP